MARAIDADAFREWWLENGENEYVYDTNAFLDSIDNWPTLTPPNEPLTRAERHQYTRQELEQLTTETAIYIEGAGIAQLQWGGLEIAEGCRDGYLYCKHIKPFAMELYNRYWTAFDGPPEEEENQK